jgi:hypothetical protein
VYLDQHGLQPLPFPPFLFELLHNLLCSLELKKEESRTNIQVQEAHIKPVQDSE